MNGNESRTKLSEVEDIEQSYNELPYPSHCFPQTHPDRLQTVARLFGVPAVDPETARILEIGCASGGNLIPMAEQLPNAELLGIDLAANQVEEGQQLIQAMSFQNIQLRQLDILEIDESLGRFDFIICHGVYSWVPDAVQQKILETFRTHLNPNGVGYVSFNTFPGWHFRGMIRDMMCYHVKNIESPTERVAQARALLTFLAQSVSKEESAYGMLLHSELESLQKQSDSYLFHEHLERFNQPIYFHQFVEALSKSSMQYLGDASVSSMWSGNFPQDVAATLNKIAPDIHQREQYSDFLRNRTFRQALMVHGAVSVDRNLTPDRIEQALVSGHFSGDQQQAVDLDPSVAITFVEKKTKRKLTSASPVFKAAVVLLSNRWPQAVPVAELYELSRESVKAGNSTGEAAEKEKIDFHNQLIQLYVSGLVQVKFASDRFVNAVSEAPEVTALARHQAFSRRIANRRHELLAVDSFVARVCQLADGNKNRRQLLERLTPMVMNGELELKVDGMSLGDVDRTQIEPLLGKALDQALSWLCTQGLLV